MRMGALRIVAGLIRDRPANGEDRICALRPRFGDRRSGAMTSYHSTHAGRSVSARIRARTRRSMAI